MMESLEDGTFEQNVLRLPYIALSAKDSSTFELAKKEVEKVSG
jgi:hypothetical protein